MFWLGVSHAAEGDPSVTDGLYGLLVARAHVPRGQGQRARCHRGDRQGLRNIEEPCDDLLGRAFKDWPKIFGVNICKWVH